MTKWPTVQRTKPFDPDKQTRSEAPSHVAASTVMTVHKPPQQDAQTVSATKPRRQLGSVGLHNDRDSARARMAAAKISSSLLLAAIAREDNYEDDLDGRDERIEVAVIEMGEQIVRSVDAICSANSMLDTPYFRNELRGLVCEHVTYQWQRDGKLTPGEYEPILFASLGRQESGISTLAGDYVAACSKAAKNPDAVAEVALPHLTMTLSSAYFNVAKMVSEHDFGLSREKLAGRLMERIKQVSEQNYALMYGGLDVSPDTVRYAMQNTINRACDFLQSEYRLAAKTSECSRAAAEPVDVSRLLGGVVSRMERDMEIMADAARKLAQGLSDLARHNTEGGAEPESAKGEKIHV